MDIEVLRELESPTSVDDVADDDAPSPQPIGDDTMCCPEGHALTRVPITDPSLRCDSCGMLAPVGTSFMSCGACDFDLCTTCARNSQAVEPAAGADEAADEAGDDAGEDAGGDESAASKPTSGVPSWSCAGCRCMRIFSSTATPTQARNRTL